MSEEMTIPNKPDTQCRKCGQFFFKGMTAMTAHCVIDDDNHDWFSPTFDNEQQIAALTAKLAVATEALKQIQDSNGEHITSMRHVFQLQLITSEALAKIQEVD